MKKIVLVLLVISSLIGCKGRDSTEVDNKALYISAELLRQTNDHENEHYLTFRVYLNDTGNVKHNSLSLGNGESLEIYINNSVHPLKPSINFTGSVTHFYVEVLLHNLLEFDAELKFRRKNENDVDINFEVPKAFELLSPYDELASFNLHSDAINFAWGDNAVPEIQLEVNSLFCIDFRKSFLNEINQFAFTPNDIQIGSGCIANYSDEFYVYAQFTTLQPQVMQSNSTLGQGKTVILYNIQHGKTIGKLDIENEV